MSNFIDYKHTSNTDNVLLSTKEKEENKRKAEIHLWKKTIITNIKWYTLGCTVFIFLVIIARGLTCAKFEISDAVVISLLTTFYSSVVMLSYIVLKNLFKGVE